MGYVFKKHYTRDEARALLPQIREWLERASALRRSLSRLEDAVTATVAEGHDTGGENVNRSLRTLADFQQLMREFQARQILVKDLDRGLIDFPAILGGREVFLCLEKDEEDIDFWHDLEAGFAGREKL